MGRFLQWRQATIKLPQQLPQRLMSCVVHVVNFTSKKHINSFFSICWLWSVMGLTSSLLQLERKNSWTSQKHTATSSDSPLMLVSWMFPAYLWLHEEFHFDLQCYLLSVSLIFPACPTLANHRIWKRASTFIDVHFLLLTPADFVSCLCTVLFYQLECLWVADSAMIPGSLFWFSSVDVKL